MTHAEQKINDNSLTLCVKLDDLIMILQLLSADVAGLLLQRRKSNLAKYIIFHREHEVVYLLFTSSDV